MYEMKNGYAFELETNGGGPLTSPDEGWETVCYSATGAERFIGMRRIDDSRCAVFLCPDGAYRAQTAVYTAK